MAASGTDSRSLDKLARLLNAWDTRLRVVQSVIWAPRGLGIGLALGLVLAVAARLWPLVTRVMLIPFLVLLSLIGLVAALIGVWLWKRSTLDMAHRFDRAFALKERMSTAVELATGRLPVESEHLADRQYHQAVRVASRVRPSEGLPLRADWREWAALALPIVAIAISLWLPNPQEAVIEEREAIEEAIAEQIEELEELREEVLNNDELSPEEQQQIVEALDEAIETLEQSGVSQEEAMAALDAAEETLRDLGEEMAAEQQAALEAASEALNETAAEAAAEALAEGDLEAAAEALENLDADSLTPEEQQALADSLEAAAEALEGTNSEAAEALRDAAEALRSGDAAAAEEALGQAADAIAEGGEGQQTVEQVDEYADRIGKGEGEVTGAGRGQGGDQPGQGGMGQAQPGQGGAGEGQEQQEGQGSGGSGRGEGQGESQGGPEDPMGTNNGPGDGGETSDEEIYDPRRIGGEGGPEVDVPGDPGAGAPTGNEGELVDNPQGDSQVPYSEVYPDYEDAANEALDNGYVPLGLRELIRKYFGSLDPTGN